MSIYSAHKSAHLSPPNHPRNLSLHYPTSSSFQVNHMIIVTDSLNKELTATAEATPVHLLNDDYITNSDIIRLLPKTNKNTIKHWRHTDPTFPDAYKVGKYNYYSKTEFATWFAARKLVKNPELALVAVATPDANDPAADKAAARAAKWVK